MDALSNEDRHPLKSNYPCFLSTRSDAGGVGDVGERGRRNERGAATVIEREREGEQKRWQDGRERASEWFFLYNQ